jgi:biopolymer transport protein ExbD
MSRLRRRKKGAISLPEISLTPLIDTALTLLIIFMITTPMVNNSIKIDLPEGSMQEADQVPDELVLYLDQAGATYLNDQAVSNDELIDKIISQMNQRVDKTIFIKADKASNYGKVIQLVDQIKRIKEVKYVALATKKVSQKT